MQGFAGKAAIAGIGMTELSRASGKTELQLAAQAARAALDDAALTWEHLYAVVAQSRPHAVRNPRAVQRKKLELDDYAAGPMIASPLRRQDCCQETDGGCALVVTSARRFPDAPKIHAVVR